MRRPYINRPTTLEMLHLELGRIDHQLVDARAREIDAALARFKEEVALLGISEDAVCEALGYSRRKRRPPAQYYDPKSGKTWCGTGRRPKWLAGKRLEEYLIERM